MTAITRHRGRTTLAALTALSLGVIGALGTSAAANAAPIDPDQSGQILIHKFANPGNGDMNPDGTGDAPDPNPIEGVVFEYCLIEGIDLVDGTNTGWDQLNDITASEKDASADQAVMTLDGFALTGCEEMPATNTAGGAQSTSLPVGAYFVREVSAPSTVVVPAAPFIVTIPTPADNTTLDGEWVYDVNVYPKNTVAEGPTKNVVNQPTDGVLLGAPIEYQVTQLIPALATGEDYTKFVMTDTLDAKLDPITTYPVTVTVPDGSVTFAEGVDFVAAWSGQTLTVTFTQAGLDKLEPALNVVFDFQAKANAAGEITNQAFVNLNDFDLSGDPNGPDGSPSTTTLTRWGDLTVEKVNAADSTDGLEGAQFQVYMGTTDQGCTADIAGLQQVTMPGTTTPYVVTAGTDGIVTIPGLWVGDTEMTVDADGTVSNTSATGHDYQARCYVLEEIVAPAGFVLPVGVDALTPVLVQAGVNGAVPLTSIENVQQGVPELPFTGANGQLMMTIGGIALVVIAFGGVLMIRRRNNRSEQH